MNSRQIGKFYIAGIESKERPEEIAKIFSLLKFVPTRVEYLWHRKEFEYIGISLKFKELEIGKKIPQYFIIVTKKNGKITKVTVEVANEL